MKALDLKAATEEELNAILSQAERRLDALNGFATAADQRAATVAGASVALSAAASAVALQALGKSVADPVSVGAAMSAVMFFFAAYWAMQSAQCLDVHPPGYRPEDFVEDVQTRKPNVKRLAEMAEDLNERLEFNSRQLSWRGSKVADALRAMLLAPGLGVGSSAATWVILR